MNGRCPLRVRMGKGLPADLHAQGDVLPARNETGCVFVEGLWYALIVNARFDLRFAEGARRDES